MADPFGSAIIHNQGPKGMADPSGSAIIHNEEWPTRLGQQCSAERSGSAMVVSVMIVMVGTDKM